MVATVSNRQSAQDDGMQLESHATDGSLGDAAGAEKGGLHVSTSYPDGGAAAWAVAIGTSAVLFCTLGYVNSFGCVF